MSTKVTSQSKNPAVTRPQEDKDAKKADGKKADGKTEAKGSDEKKVHLRLHTDDDYESLDSKLYAREHYSDRGSIDLTYDHVGTIDDWGMCPDHKRDTKGLKRAFQDKINGQYRSHDFDGVEQSLKDMANVGFLKGQPVASKLLHNFLDSGGDVDMDHTGFFSRPNESAWISDAPNTKKVTDEMDKKAEEEIRRRVENGETSGVIRIQSDVETNPKEDGDLYYALGKFMIEGEYRFDVNKGFLGMQDERITVDRKYTAADRYDWDPPRKCGIVDHVIPYALEREGRADSFNVKVNWDESKMRLFE